MILNSIIAFALLLGSGYIGYRMWVCYKASEGTVWERLLATAKQSATIFIQYLVILGSTLITWLSYGAELLNLPDVRNFLQEKMQPEYVGALFAVVAMITVVARLRSMDR